ncbi:gliding motility-associated C-terminal domain-containing protein [Hymenobacter sp. BT683]|uniref:Gliding motility-associated C-terminal domain-containing protein n=1 Tax=Hymenobacter jeongseonensis TaxID=2791027 RepID=A0ABS0IF73_9BACT|nr:gliding motility-associated C-terminal domain-containing protein [Hymenobacter jeongseonensis]MBF9237009.1 gliding motility-associated C-terminal domain-containing protein [Hymenobacter jeongseonensis]
MRIFLFNAVLLWLFLGPQFVSASHLVGGELTYKYLDARGPAGAPHRYSLTARIYYDGNTRPSGDPTITIGIDSRATPKVPITLLTVQRYGFSVLGAEEIPGCAVSVPRVTLALYLTTVNLPFVREGYQAVVSIAARNAGITNLNTSSGQAFTISVDMTPGLLPNSSPAFSDDAFVVACLGDTASILNNAYDVDGDRLSYSFGVPNGAGVGALVAYAPGYSATLPFGPGSFAEVDPRTGLSRYLGVRQGTFLVAVDVREYRTINGEEVLLGTLRRDLQVVVRACSGPTNPPPSFTAATLAQTSFQVEEGQALAFDIVATDPTGQPLAMTVSSVLLDGAGPIQATLNGQAGGGNAINPLGIARIGGTGTVTGAFRLLANCGLARTAPYDLAVTVNDDGCGSKTIAGVFRVTITKPAAPTRVQGDSVLCGAAAATYTAIGPAAATYRWTVRGGQVLGPAAGPSIQVRWTTNGPGAVTVRGISAAGCLTDSAFQAVAVEPGPPITGPAAYCRQSSTGLAYSIAGPPAAYQWSITDGTIVSGQGTNAVQIDIPSGATAVLQAANPAQTTCVTTLRIALDDRCLYFYNVITPNGDGQNDLFVIENVERYPNTALSIFNRWGQPVYQSRDYRNTYGGQGAGPGLYYYLCQLTDGTAYKGWFEVIR